VLHTLLMLQIYFFFLIFVNNKIAKATTYLVLEKFIPGRCIVQERTWPGRGTFCPILGLSRTFHSNSHALVGTPASRSECFPSGPPYSIPGSAPVNDLCGADELWIFV